jgi:hypothetical protein
MSVCSPLLSIIRVDKDQGYATRMSVAYFPILCGASRYIYRNLSKLLCVSLFYFVRPFGSYMQLQKKIVIGNLISLQISYSWKSEVIYLYRVSLKSLNLKDSVVLTLILLFEPVSQLVQRYHNVISCGFNMWIPFRTVFVNPVSN